MKHAVIMALILCGVIAAAGFLLSDAHARNITLISDSISSSRPTSSANHTIRFQTQVAIPPSGKIIITPHPGAFTVTSTFSYSDVDLATSSALTGPYTDRSLAASANAISDGVAVVSGTSGSVTFTLNSSAGIAANAFISIELGINATFGTSGVRQITNPATAGSYRIDIETQDAGSVTLGTSRAMIAIVRPVVTFATSTGDITPPTRSNGSPSGAIPNGVTAVELSLDTNESANCRYATTSGMTYGTMTKTFAVANASGSLHVATESNLPFATHNYYVRCRDTAGNENPDDFAITFTTQVMPPPAPPPAPPAPPPAGAGAAGFRPFPAQPSAPEVSFRGIAYPFARVSILQDGVVKTTVTAQSTGAFSATLAGLSPGTFTFGISAEDTDGRKSLVFSTTLTLQSGSQSVVSDILLHPTYALAQSALDPGDPLGAVGQTAPGGLVESWLYPRSQQVVSESTVTVVTSTADSFGDWALAYDTSRLTEGTYAFKARAALTGAGTTGFGPLLYFGVGEAPALDNCARSDINSDGKVNLVDFSILLFNWQSSDAASDINSDGTVNLTDFSIMLFCWTG